jgi:hypothetical protein
MIEEIVKAEPDIESIVVAGKSGHKILAASIPAGLLRLSHIVGQFSGLSKVYRI